MPLARIFCLLALFTLALAAIEPAAARQPLLPSDLYKRSHVYYGHPPVFEQKPKPQWYPWGHFGAHGSPPQRYGVHRGFFHNEYRWKFSGSQ